MTEDNDEWACLDHITPPTTPALAPAAPAPAAPDGAEGWDIAYRAAAEAKYKDWSPLKEQQQAKIEEEVRQMHIARLREETASEQYLIETYPNPPTQLRWHGLPAADPAYLFNKPLETLGVAEGTPEFDEIDQGLSWKCKRMNPAQNASRHDYFDMGWPTNAGPSRRFVTPEEDLEIQRQLANSSLTPPGSAEQLVSYSFLDLIHKKIPEPRWLIEDILREGGAAMIYGPGSIGKSFFIHTLVLMAARGNPEEASEIGTSILGHILECNTAAAVVD
jgi:AAA domain